MSYLKADLAKANNELVTSFSTIARSLMNMDTATRERMKRKFDICYVVAKERIAFSKYTALYDFESRHLRVAYRNDVSAKSFTGFIAQSQHDCFVHFLIKLHFFSFLMDGTTDSGKVEDELVVVLYCKDDVHKEIRSCARYRYLSVVTPNKAGADGLVNCLRKALQTLKIDDILDRDAVLSAKPVLIRGGTDGVSVNIGRHNSMRAKLQGVLEWLFWAGCYAHRLELASKNGIASSLFKEIEELLLRLYYLYEKSPKKTRELASIVQDLKEAFDFPGTGNVPLQSQGSHWINHKRRALQRVSDWYGAYMSHLIALSEDMSLKREDRARLKGNVQKWTHAKFLVGCAMYTEVLKPPSTLSLSLQGSDVDIVFGIKQLLKASTTLRSMVKQDPLQRPTVKIVLDRMKNDGGENVYQGVALKRFDVATLSY